MPGLWGRSIADSSKDGPAVAKLKVSMAGKIVGFGKNNFGNLPEHGSQKVSRKEDHMGACHGHGQYLVPEVIISTKN